MSLLSQCAKKKKSSMNKNTYMSLNSSKSSLDTHMDLELANDLLICIRVKQVHFSSVYLVFVVVLFKNFSSSVLQLG